MKKNSYFLFCVSAVVSLFQACNEDQQMTSRADGEWTIEQITFTRNGQDSVVMAPIGVFHFEECKLGTGNCPGYYDLENQDRVTIGYNVDANLNEFNMAVLSDAVVYFGGKYQIDQFDKENLRLSGEARIKQEEGLEFYDVTIDLKKK